MPRFDLLKFDHYLHVGVQFSRGCPFTCEFCDIIELYGRVPRAKTNAQMLTELDALYACGYRGHVDFVDDNMIGNKKALKKFLPELIAWQKERGYPFEFSTEASVNLADDDELLGMLRAANFFAVFVGIETPDPDNAGADVQEAEHAPRSRRQHPQDLRRGIFVTAGFIVGFDGEKSGRRPRHYPRSSRMPPFPICMVGLLYALPNTQLTRRLAKEGRLFPNHDVMVSKDGDQCTLGLNFETTRPRQEILRDCQTHRPRYLQSEGVFRARPPRRSGAGLLAASHAARAEEGPVGRLGVIWALTRMRGAARVLAHADPLRHPQSVRDHTGDQAFGALPALRAVLANRRRMLEQHIADAAEPMAAPAVIAAADGGCARGSICGAAGTRRGRPD